MDVLFPLAGPQFSNFKCGPFHLSRPALAWCCAPPVCVAACKIDVALPFRLPGINRCCGKCLSSSSCASISLLQLLHRRVFIFDWKPRFVCISELLTDWFLTTNAAPSMLTLFIEFALKMVAVTNTLLLRLCCIMFVMKFYCEHRRCAASALWTSRNKFSAVACATRRNTETDQGKNASH